MLLNDSQIHSFQQLIWDFYRTNGRSFAWRTDHNPYNVVISEIMLQQTQTYRVEPKFEQFITTFPSFAHLAESQLRDLLFVWQGLGYNRRAMALHSIAKRVMQEWGGELPASVEMLQTLPGIGQATASSIGAFAFNMPTTFIETNIRAVFIHTFCNNGQMVHDKILLPLVEQTLDHTNPREWYYALMDYGVFLKKEHKNPARRSVHHIKQSRFEGSDRQIRGAIIRQLTCNGPIARVHMMQILRGDIDRVNPIIDQLIVEGFIQQDVHSVLSIA